MWTEQITGSDGFAVGYDGESMAPLTAAARFRLRVQDVLEERNLTQKSLRGDKSEGWISNVLSGTRGLKLNDAVAIADALQIPLAELLRRPDDRVYELDILEARLVDAFRQLTKDEQDALLTVASLRQRPAPYASGRALASQLRNQARGFPTPLSTAPLTPELRAITARYEREISAAIARGQAPNDGAHGARTSTGDRRLRRSRVKPAG